MYAQLFIDINYHETVFISGESLSIKTYQFVYNKDTKLMHFHLYKWCPILVLDIWFIQNS